MSTSTMALPLEKSLAQPLMIPLEKSLAKPLEKPSWLKTRVSPSKMYDETLKRIENLGLNTVCQEAACPNIQECWSKAHATVMILGRICTRACRFCNVATGKPTPVDSQEPHRVATLVKTMGLSHVVVTSVDRDDLVDGGATHFATTIQAIRDDNPATTIEVLTPDFLGKDNALEIVLEAKPHVFNHNVETIPRLYAQVRPKARYFHSLYLLKKAKLLYPQVFTKSGLMVGLGEENAEIRQVMNDLRSADVDFLTIGQYLQPSPKHHPVMRYVDPQEYEVFKATAYKRGFLYVAASPWTRSSYHAGDDFLKMVERRQAEQGQ